MGGKTEQPTYEEVCTNTTGHIEVVQLDYDSTVTDYDELLKVFFGCHDPTSWDRQDGDVGEQYRSVVFYHSEDQRRIAETTIAELNRGKKYEQPIVTVVRPASTFYRAEEYHQNYYHKPKS